MLKEKVIRPQSGWGYLVVLLPVVVLTPIVFFLGALRTEGGPSAAWFLTCSAVEATALTGLCGFIAVQPNEARALLLFGKYKGTVRESGFYWVNPFYTKTKVSLRVRNFETGSSGGEGRGKPAKVNDRDGNPVDISAVVVWKVVDTAEALFEVDNFEHYVEVQSEAALRNMASRHPYDCEDDAVSLRGNTEEISAQLREDIQARLDKAGVETIEARISHLAYAPEIAAAMLQRQQAQAVVAARTKIVEGAVGMVDMALKQLAADEIVEMDAKQRSDLVSNLLVVLCSDRHTQPVVNTGTAA